VKHLLVTNDFPPKIGGIQSLLWEWWRRLPPDRFAVLTSPYDGATAWDAQQPYRIERTREPVLLPHPLMIRQVNALARDFGADFVVLDPAVPLGLIGPSLDRPYDLVLHGAEVTVPGRLPGSKQALAYTLTRARRIIAAGGYPAAEAEHAAGRELPITVVPCGVDPRRFRPLTPRQRTAARQQFDLDEDAEVVLGLSRLVPRKGFDTMIRAAARLARTRPKLVMAIGGTGREAGHLQRLADELGAPVRFLGRVAHDDLPQLYGCVDVFSMLCRSRWSGLEQEGFGIVFVEAAACGIAQVAGDSGGAAEAVEDGVTGIVLDDPDNIQAAADAYARLLDDDDLRASMGAASRRRAIGEFSYDLLAARLGAVLGIDARPDTDLPGSDLSGNEPSGNDAAAALDR
jgi:phosphatidylinositol alpha-1,6-mannosyltransferase